MRKTLLIAALATALHATAQTDDIYRMEVGGGVGLVASEGDYYHVYLFNDASATANDTARADLSLRILKSAAQGDVVPFSSDGGNEVLTVTYNGETYNKATVDGDTPNANGGNATMTLSGDQLDLTSTVFASVKEGKHDIKVHYKGKATVL